MSNAELPGRILFTRQVGPVTFFIVESGEMCILYAESKKEGAQNLGECFSYDEAHWHLEREINKLEEILEGKRKQLPTPNQLMFLFKEKIPIPLDLTWGGAFDLIKARIASNKLARVNEREVKAREKGCMPDMPKISE